MKTETIMDAAREAEESFKRHCERINVRETVKRDTQFDLMYWIREFYINGYLNANDIYSEEIEHLESELAKAKHVRNKYHKELAKFKKATLGIQRK